MVSEKVNCESFSRDTQIENDSDTFRMYSAKADTPLRRKIVWKSSVLERYGYLGKSNRMHLASCVLARIPRAYPDVNGSCMALKES